MATLTITVVTDTPNTGDIRVRSAGSPTYSLVIPSSAHQTKRLVQCIESLVMSELSLVQ
jgi:hypothetical protein